MQKINAHHQIEEDTLLASDTNIETLGTPAVNKLQEYLDSTGSAGWFSGGTLSNSGSGEIDIAAGSGFIRATSSDLATLLSFEWSAFLNVPIPSDTIRYVYISYNGGSPTYVLSASEFDEAADKILIGVAVNEAGNIESVFNVGVRLAESIGNAGRFIRNVLSISRDVRRGGLMLGQSGTRNVTLSAGSLWWGRTRYPISALDTSVSGSFDVYYYNGSVWVQVAAQTQWPNTQYNDITSGLVTMTANQWAALWVYLEADDHVVFVYGRDQYVTQNQAEMESPPSTLPNRLTATGVLTARFIFKKSDATATINSAFDTHFNPSAGGGGFTQEEIEDFIGAMVSGNTETGIDVTYDDASAKLNFVAEVTQAELDAHTGDTTDAHDGTAISFVDSGGNYLSTDVQTALLEIEFIAKKDFRAYLVRINTQTISATKTLTDSDKVMQFLTASGGDQKVLLPAPAVTNAGTFIANVGGSNSIIVRNSGDTTTYITLTPGTSALLLSNATSWYVLQPITDANLPTSDITTNDLSTTKHGFAPKAPNDTNKYLRGDATWGVPAGGSGADKYPFEARLTLETGVPYSLTPQTAKTTIYLTPYHGNQIAVYDGAAWDVLTLSGDISASLAGLTANLPYDVFVYDSSGTLTLELVAWTNGTTRATAIVTQDGIDVKSGATTRRLAGTILITGTTGQCEMSATFCGISNRYNLLPHGLFSCPGYSDGSSNSTYTTTSTTFVEANGGTGSRIKFVLCKERLTEIHMKFTGLHGSGGQAIAAAGIDTITNPNTSVASAPGIFIPMYDVNNFNGVPLAVGSHYAALLFCAAAAGTITAYADIGTTRSGASQDSRTTWIQAAIWM